MSFQYFKKIDPSFEWLVIIGCMLNLVGLGPNFWAYVWPAVVESRLRQFLENIFLEKFLEKNNFLEKFSRNSRKKIEIQFNTFDILTTKIGID
jgi:hypothetical protein